MAVGLPFQDVAARLRAALVHHHPQTVDIPGFRPASVLVALLARPDGPHVLLTRRSDEVPHHKGQIAFPGGAREAGETAIEAALREAEEEVALPGTSVEVVGRLDDHPSVSNYVVTPVIGLVHEPPDRFHPQAGEVVAPLEVPLARLLAPSVLRVEWWNASDRTEIPSATMQALRERSGDFDAAAGRYRVYFYDAGPAPDQPVWGLTARILRDVLRQGLGHDDGNG